MSIQTNFNAIKLVNKKLNMVDLSMDALEGVIEATVGDPNVTITAENMLVEGNTFMDIDLSVDGVTYLDQTTIDTTDGDLLVSGNHSITLSSTENVANSIYVHANGGTLENILIHADQGTNATSINLLSDVGGIALTSGLNAANSISLTSTSNIANGIYVHANGGTAESIKIHSDLGTSATSIQLLSDVGGIAVTSGLNAANSISLTSTSNVANGIYVHANGGIAETVLIHSDLGTSATSINLVSDAGGITLNATGNVTVTNSGHVGGDWVVDGDLLVSGNTTTMNTTTVLVEDKAIELGVTAVPSDVTALDGGIILKGTTDKTILWNGGSWLINQTIDIVSTGTDLKIAGNSVMNATTIGSGVTASSLTSVGTLTGLTVTSTTNAANTIQLNTNGGTLDTVLIHSNKGTSASSINLLSTLGGITETALGNIANSIYVHANGGTSENILIHSDLGNTATSIHLLSDAGGITLNAASNVAVTNGITIGTTLDVNGASTLDQVTIDTTDGAFNVAGNNTISLGSTQNAANSIYLHANGGIAETVLIHSDLGNTATSIHLLSDAGGITLNAAAGYTSFYGGLVGGSADTITNASVAISLLTPVTFIDATNEFTATIADGTSGQLKFLTTIAGTSNVVIANTNLNVTTQLLFDAVGEGATLVYDPTSAKWSVIGTTGTIS